MANQEIWNFANRQSTHDFLRVAITLIIASYQIIIGNDIGINILVLPLFGLIYILIIELFAEFTIESLKKKVEKILKTENRKLEL